VAIDSCSHFPFNASISPTAVTQLSSSLTMKARSPGSIFSARRRFIVEAAEARAQALHTRRERAV